jgi:hypothetical protein
MQSTQMQDSQLSVIHKKFGEDFCGLLRASGSANLAKANECSLFLGNSRTRRLCPYRVGLYLQYRRGYGGPSHYAWNS